MSGVVLLFDPRSSVLERAAAALEAAGVRPIRCYSDARLGLAARRCETADPVVVCSASRRQSALASVPAGRLVTFDEKEPFDDLLGPELRRVVSIVRELGNRNRRSSRCRKDLDLVIIASSTGGFPVVQTLLKGLMPTETSIVICQHISAAMSVELARVASDRVPIGLVTGRARVAPGRVYLLQGEKDFVVKRQGTQTFLVAKPPDSSHYHPSATRLLASVAQEVGGPRCAVAILSGLGDDGAAAVPAITASGCTVIAQNPATSKAPGMPTAAVATGAVTHVFSGSQMHEYLSRRIR